MMNFVDAAGRTSLSLGASFVLGGLIGIERQYRQRTAGLRTNVLVAVGACQFINSAIMIAGAEGGARVLSYVVSGIGFLGAGAIMKEGANVTGLNTAATLWCSAAVGACCGASQEMQALILTIFVIAGNTALRPIVNAINRTPFNAKSTEATYQLMIVTSPDQAAHTREHVIETLQGANYPISQIQIGSFPQGAATIIATLYSTSVDPKEMDRILENIRRLECVSDVALMSRVGE